MGINTSNKKGDSLSVKKENHKHNIVGSPVVDSFLTNFDLNKIGTCLKMIEEGEIIILDKNSLLEKMETHEILVKNNALLQETIDLVNHDLSIIIDTSSKLEKVMSPIDEIIQPEIEKVKNQGKEDIPLRTWIKVFTKLAPVFYKQQKEMKKVFSELDLKGLENLIQKYKIHSHEEVNDDTLRKLENEPTGHKQLDSPNSPDSI